MRFTQRLILAAATLAGFAAPWPLAAQETYPSRPIRFIVTFAAGGGVDIPARQFARGVEEALGQTVVVDNKPGAGGMVGAVEAARAKPDGYTIVLGTVAQLIGKKLQPSVAFDPLADFAPISLVYKTQGTIAVSGQTKVKSISELVAWGKANPGTLNYYTGGVGTFAHLLGATLSEKTGMNVVHIPVRTVNDMLPQLTDSTPHFACFVTPSTLSLVKSGRMRALAVSSRERLSQLPDVPTLFELFKDADLVQEGWLGVWAPAGTPAPVIKRLFEATTKAARSAAFSEAMDKQGQTVTVSASPEEFASYMKAESDKWGALISRLQIKPN
jgi:tripartite-type tricarboxylate transporter receptor subunit TctC